MKKLLSYISMALVISLLVNMLPVSVLAEKLQEITADTEIVTNATEENPEETTQEEIISEDAHVVAEITEKRTEFSKEFLLSNGLHMAMVYADAVHFETESGWEEIDNTLKTNADGSYSNTAGVWNVTFPDQLGEDESIIIEKDGYTLSFFMSGELTAGSTMAMSATTEDLPLQMFGVSEVLPAVGEIRQLNTAAMVQSADYPETVPVKLQAQIAYAGAYPNTDIIYDLDSNKVKESMILESYNPGLQGYSYTLEVGAMIPVLGEDGSVVLYDENQENIVMVMPAPYLIDNGGTHNYDIEVQLLGKGSTYTLIYLLPQEWLAADDRAWPVILDPAIQPELTVDNIKDDTVFELEVNENPDEPKWYYNWGMIQVGYDGSDEGVSRSYLMYELLPPITSSDIIIEARICLYKPTTSGTSAIVEVHKVNSTWESEGLTWANKPSFNSSIEDYAFVQDAGYYEWEITDIARDWYSNKNTGMMFKVSDAIEAAKTDNYKQFYSSDHTDNNEYQPQLVIFFRNNNGLESYWDYTVSDAGRAGTGYINNYTGNLTWVRNDIGFGGNRMPVTIQHIYNLNDAIVPNDPNNSNDSGGNGFGMGIGWRTNFNQLVYQWNLDDSYYIWEDSDGTDHYFKLEDGTYQDEDGLELTLTINNNGTEKYCITDKYGNCSYFDTYGRLTKMSNNQAIESCITISYTTTSGMLISTVTDGVGRKYNFSYPDGLLTRISYTGSDSTELSYVTFSYDGDLLEQVEDQDNKASTYTYSGNLLASATDIDGYTLTYSYNTIAPDNDWQPYRVMSVAESDGKAQGGSLTFSYAHNETKITDYNSNTQIYQFNDFGNTVSVQDDEGRAQFTQFARTQKDDNVGKANQLTVASKLQNTVGNLLPHSSFETGTYWTSNDDTLTLKRTTAKAYQGKYSLKLTNSSGNLAAALRSSYIVNPDETYTFSAYVYSVDASGLIALHYNGIVQGGSHFSAGQNWTRLQITYTNDTDAPVSVTCCLFTNSAGTVYMDCVQFEQAAVASRFNLVENSNFFYSGSPANSWTGTNLTADDTVSPVDSAAPQLETHALKIEGDPSKVKSVYQRIDIIGKAGDSFVLAGWAKADSVPLSGNRTFGVWISFYGYSSTGENEYLGFNPYADNWQYAAKAIIAPYDYNYIVIEISYSYNANTAYFDGIQLYREEFGNSYTYDDKGNVISVKDLQGQVTQYIYDEQTKTNLLQIKQSNSAKMTYTYDDWHNVEIATTDEGLKYEFEYDDYGNNIRVSTTTAGKTMQSTAEYTTDGNRLVSTTDALGNTTTYCYNEDTNVLEWVRYPEDTEDTRTEYTYDGMYRTASAACTTDTGLRLSVGYSYDNDLLTSITTPSTTYTFTYGDFGLRTGVSIGDRTLATYHYTLEKEDDRKYDLDRLDYGNRGSVKYEYDDQGRITKQTYEDDAYVAYFYDGDGNLGKTYDSASGITASYIYDLTGRLVEYTELGGGYEYSVSYSYNQENQLSTVKEIVDGHDRTSTYQYDDDGRITFFEKVLARRRYRYDAWGRVYYTQTLGKDYKTVLNTSYSYAVDANLYSNQVTDISHIAPNYTKSYRYTYDNNGNILSVQDGMNTTSYVYDSANQLIRENNQAGNFTHVWVYDNAGNILERREYAYTVDSLENEIPTNIVVYTYGDNQWRDLLTAYNGNVITYDEIGNPLYDGTWTYTWQHGRQLASMSDGTTTWTYTYDAKGLRIGRTDGTTNYRYIYEGSQLTFMARNGLLLRFAYTPEGTPLSILYKGTTYYYVTNLQGDVTAILSQNGYVMVEYTYDAWGNLLTTTGPLANSLGLYNPLRYRGYIYDYETGLYYLQSRYYNPQTGRFLNADEFVSTGQGFLGNNMFAYCNNNPVVCIDFSGQFPWLVIGLLAVFAVGGGVAGYFYDGELGPTVKVPEYNAPPESLPPSERVPETENILENKALSQTEKNELSVGDRLKNAAIGASLGLLAGGAVVSTGGVGLCVAGYAQTTITVLGMTGMQVFATGAVLYNFFGMVVAPFFGVEMETIEYEP